MIPYSLNLHATDSTEYLMIGLCTSPPVNNIEDVYTLVAEVGLGVNRTTDTYRRVFDERFRTVGVLTFERFMLTRYETLYQMEINLRPVMDIRMFRLLFLCLGAPNLPEEFFRMTWEAAAKESTCIESRATALIDAVEGLVG